MLTRFTFLLVGCLAGFEALADADERVLSFPEDRAVGVVHQRPAVAGSYRNTQYDDWEIVGEARGEMRIAELSDVRLDISKAASVDLGFLQQLDADAVQVLVLRDTAVSDDQLQHVGRLTGLRILNLDHCRITDAGVRHLGGLNKLHQIDLSAFRADRDGFGVSDGAMEVLGALPEMESIDLRLSKVGDAGLEHLARAKSLKSIGLAGTRVTDAGMPALLSLPHLENLRLGVYRDGVDVTDAGLETVGQLRTLTYLDLSGCNVTNEGLAHLQSLSNLEGLSLDNTNVTEEGLVHLKPLGSLERLRCYINITDAGAAHLAELKSLKRITSNLNVTDAGIARLAKLPHLESLSVSDAGVTDACFDDIETMSSLKELWFQNCGITDVGLSHIADLKSLERMNINGTNVTGDGLKVLRELPNLRVLHLNFGSRSHDYWCDRPHLREVGKVTSLEHLDIEGERLIPRDLHDLKGLVRLKHLGIEGVPVDDRAAAVIAGMTSLTHLEMDRGVMTDVGLAYLANLHQLEIIQWHGHFTNAGLTSLHSLASLHHAYLNSPYVDEWAGEELAAAVPSLRRVRVVTRDTEPAFSHSDKDHFRRAGRAAERVELDRLEGEPPPALQLDGWVNTSEDGLTFDELNGQVVLVDFWGTWCGPCVAAIPHLKELHEKYSSQGFVIVGVHSTTGRNKLAPYVSENAIPWPVAYDVDRETIEAWQVDSYPTYFLIDRSGRLRVAGLWHEDLDRAVFELLNETLANETTN